MPFEKYNLEKANLDSSQKALFWLHLFMTIQSYFYKSRGTLLLSTDTLPVGSPCTDCVPSLKVTAPLKVALATYMTPSFWVL